MLLEGREITNLPMHKRARLGIGYLTQEPSVFRKLTVEQNILAILETCVMDRDERALRLKYLLDELDRPARLAASKAYTLSGGEKRRLEITRALVTSPKLLLLDEPFSGIDPIAVYEVQKIIRRLRDRGLGILITDHTVRETLKLVDRGYIIWRSIMGEVVLEGLGSGVSGRTIPRRATSISARNLTCNPTQVCNAKSSRLNDFTPNKRARSKLRLVAKAPPTTSSASSAKGRPSNRPGLALAGFTRYFAHKRIQVMGNAESSYLNEHRR